MTTENILTHGLKTSALGSDYKTEYDENLNLLDKNRVAVGTFANRPAVGAAKRFYFASDTKALYYDDGVSWVDASDMARSVTNGNAHDHSGGDGAQISHTGLSNIGTNSHAQVDSHLADGTKHFLESSITHGNILGLASDDHLQYQLADGTRNVDLQNQLSNSGFGVWSNSDGPHNVGSAINITAVASTTLTVTAHGLTAGKLFKDFAGTVFHIDSITDVNNFVVDRTGAVTGNGYEVVPGITSGLNAFDGWSKRGGAEQFFREHQGSNTKDGSFYALKMVTTTNDWNVRFPKIPTDLTHIAEYAGRTVTFGMWVKTSTASAIRLSIYDGATSFSPYHTGGGTYEWLEVTGTISSAATNVQFQIDSQASNTSYFSQPMLVFGSSIGAGNYAPIRGEVVKIEVSALLAKSSITSQTLNVESATSGKIPKGAKRIYARHLFKNSSVSSGVGVSLGNKVGGNTDLGGYPLVNDMYQELAGWVTCNSDGTVYLSVGGATFNYSNIQILAVEV